jgi:hypothetical protein
VLTPGQPIDVTIRVRAPSNVPLDLFFVQGVCDGLGCVFWFFLARCFGALCRAHLTPPLLDLTQSFDDDMKTVNATIPQFLDAITAIVPGAL